MSRLCRLPSRLPPPRPPPCLRDLAFWYLKSLRRQLRLRYCVRVTSAAGRHPNCRHQKNASGLLRRIIRLSTSGAKGINGTISRSSFQDGALSVAVFTTKTIWSSPSGMKSVRMSLQGNTRGNYRPLFLSNRVLKAKKAYKLQAQIRDVDHTGKGNTGPVERR